MPIKIQIISKDAPGPYALVTGQAEGAWPNGSRVIKTRDEPEDAHAPGAGATILSSIGPDPETGIYGYFVEWDDMPGIPCLIAGNAIKTA